MKRTNTFITITSFILTAALLLTGCTSENGVGNAEETTTTITATQPMIDTVVTTAAIETTVEETTTTTTTTTAVTTTEATTAAETTTTEQAVTTPVTENEPAPEWTEQAMNKTTMYVNTNGIYSRKEAVIGSAKVKQYTLNSAVTVVASTDTSYYKLEDGAFIHKDYLSNQKVTVSTSAANTTAQTGGGSKQEQALAVAKEVVDYVVSVAGKEQSLYQIEVASSVVCNYIMNNVVYSQTDPDDWTAYGVFVAHKASCQGAADALGMVLTQLGYKWEHINKNLYEHQWLKVYYNYSVTLGRARYENDFAQYIEGCEARANGNSELLFGDEYINYFGEPAAYGFLGPWRKRYDDDGNPYLISPEEAEADFLNMYGFEKSSDIVSPWRFINNNNNEYDFDKVYKTVKVSGSYVYADASEFQGWIGIGSFKEGGSPTPIEYANVDGKKDGWILYCSNFDNYQWKKYGIIPYNYIQFDTAYEG